MQSLDRACVTLCNTALLERRLPDQRKKTAVTAVFLCLNDATPAKLARFLTAIALYRLPGKSTGERLKSLFRLWPLTPKFD
ncbi:hypothetical protein HQN64_02305 [Enterobacteriaceae bacterium BIT-l23]|uniref:hypothetical protein n=1 Tax=Jejubacter sp. L23 TaxID=3092086 RepID=UPI00158571FE|nr:hypothetical protein [Enterobacteriaceae bacterium BIT-l23]